jgi:hypothetical protein
MRSAADSSKIRTRAAIWFIRFHALTTWRERMDMAQWLRSEPSHAGQGFELAVRFDLNDEWEFDADRFRSAVESVARGGGNVARDSPDHRRSGPVGLPAWFASLAAAAKSAATRARSHRSGFIHGQASATQLVAVNLSDGTLRAFGIAHLDKRESARLAGRAITNDVDGAHVSGRLEQGLKIGFGGFKRQVADVKLGIHTLLLHHAMH